MATAEPPTAYPRAGGDDTDVTVRVRAANLAALIAGINTSEVQLVELEDGAYALLVRGGTLPHVQAAEPVAADARGLDGLPEAILASLGFNQRQIAMLAGRRLDELHSNPQLDRSTIERELTQPAAVRAVRRIHTLVLNDTAPGRPRSAT